MFVAMLCAKRKENLCGCDTVLCAETGENFSGGRYVVKGKYYLR